MIFAPDRDMTVARRSGKSETEREGEGVSLVILLSHIWMKSKARAWVNELLRDAINGGQSAGQLQLQLGTGGNYANRLKIAHWNRTISYKVFLIWVNLAFTFLINFSSAIKIQFLAWPTLINGRAISQSCEGETNGERVGGEDDVKAACEKDANTVGQITKTTTITIEKR